MDAIKVCDLFDLTHTRAAKMLAACEYPWEALSKIGETVLAIGQGLELSDYDHPAEECGSPKFRDGCGDGQHRRPVRHR